MWLCLVGPSATSFSPPPCHTPALGFPVYAWRHRHGWQLGWALAGCCGIRDRHVVLPSPSSLVSIPSGGLCLRADSYPSAGLALSSWPGVLSSRGSPSAGFASSPLASVSSVGLGMVCAWLSPHHWAVVVVVGDPAHRWAAFRLDRPSLGCFGPCVVHHVGTGFGGH